MPIYEYVCEECGKSFEHLARSMASRNEKVACPACSSAKTERKMSVFAVAAAQEKPAPMAGPGACGCACGREGGCCGLDG